MLGKEFEFIRDDDATMPSRDFDPVHVASHDTGVHGAEHSLSEVVVLDDTDPSLIALDGYLIERNRRLHETIRLLQEAMAEWVVVSGPVTAQEKKTKDRLRERLGVFAALSIGDREGSWVCVAR